MSRLYPRILEQRVLWRNFNKKSYSELCDHYGMYHRILTINSLHSADKIYDDVNDHYKKNEPYITRHNRFSFWLKFFRNWEAMNITFLHMEELP